MKKRVFPGFSWRHNNDFTADDAWNAAIFHDFIARDAAIATIFHDLTAALFHFAVIFFPRLSLFYSSFYIKVFFVMSFMFFMMSFLLVVIHQSVLHYVFYVLHYVFYVLHYVFSSRRSTHECSSLCLFFSRLSLLSRTVATKTTITARKTTILRLVTNIPARNGNSATHGKIFRYDDQRHSGTFMTRMKRGCPGFFDDVVSSVLAARSARSSHPHHRHAPASRGKTDRSLREQSVGTVCGNSVGRVPFRHRHVARPTYTTLAFKKFQILFASFVRFHE